ncbi:hypothetical protein GCM10010168_25390 [Actinoplanes ianthinogenes]|uniref:Uncharacterized protein n=1 Tax=Actinoplanes ianthinogenes TaxID=122358 RepID=A0ABN6CTW7_9ACTN|nr:hypothetical protein [Actinoplanes ianthinogenes]BCJ48179.1 hypothetical protein Aiant_88360 [Actinoplanes ianthinogenes]GGR06987.1 hypothetical protein GCM10010168_25390 [Actinoplanes ianthinogenes]
MGHVLARLNGHGMALVPHWPYSFARVDGDADAVRVTRTTPDGPISTVISPGGPVEGGEVVDVSDGMDVPAWLIETGPALLPWPRGFSLESPADPSDTTPFYLFGPDQAMIFPQGPVAADRLADPDALVADYQTVLDRRTDEDDVSVVELGYQHDGQQWWQGHWMIPLRGNHVLVLTGQGPLAGAEMIREAAAYAAHPQR